MFLVIPLVEFLHVRGVDINVHHENPATFLCHVSVSSSKRSRHRFASSRGTRSSRLEPRTRHETTTWEAIFAGIPQIPGLLSAIFRLIEARRNEIRAQPASFAANRSVARVAGSGTRGFASGRIAEVADREHAINRRMFSVSGSLHILLAVYITAVHGIITRSLTT
jgi:hypothetical protein